MFSKFLYSTSNFFAPIVEIHATKKQTKVLKRSLFAREGPLINCKKIQKFFH